ncbi:MAG: hypothetical protein M1816_008150 [Peltula sp. TS41687]|nr:MAG: hypothetical protein M1816_008150 [Peltula sp. TS41687]
MSSVATVFRFSSSPSQPSGSDRQGRSSEDDHTQNIDSARPGSETAGRDHSNSLQIRRAPSSSSTVTSLNQNIPARSYFHRSFHGSHVEARQFPPQLVREQTAELASYALSDVASSIYGDSPPSRLGPTAIVGVTTGCDPDPGGQWEEFEEPRRGPDHSLLPDVIQEDTEPASPSSLLTEMLRRSPSSERGNPTDSLSRDDSEHGRLRDQSSEPLREGARSTANERTSLLPKSHDRKFRRLSKSGEQDLESQRISSSSRWLKIHRWPSRANLNSLRCLISPKHWTIRRHDIIKPVAYVPAVVLGLLLNILDALSYGMILFPLGQPIFEGLGPDGLSMFYVSCIISQLVYSFGGSSFKGGVGSEMIEVVPFFHKMAFTILAQVGEDNRRAVLATTILAYSVSSIITGLVFFGMGACRLGSLIGFFPRHILIGCIGGVGWFLFATGVEVSARLNGELQYTLPTLKSLFRIDTIFLWMTPLLLAVLLIVCQHWIKHPLFVSAYFLMIPAVFYLCIAAIPDLHLDDLRRLGWVFDLPAASTPFYHFYTLYDFRVVDWAAFFKTVPAMFALTFFGVLHVPINVPALGFSTGRDNVNVDRELVAHGVSNVLSGMAGSIQNYLVYTNSLLFIRSGGNSRIAGFMLALGTCGLLVLGPTIIGYIPIMVVGALIFLLGIELLREALYDTWGRVHRLEYLTIIAIVVIMGAWDFVIGILAGIVLACFSFVVQNSRISAIRAAYTGEIARSTVRRNQAQYRFLRQVGRQIHVAKLAGFLFFGTIVSVEKQIRALLDEEAFSERPIRFLILDMSHVNGIDFSAAEAFTRINRLLTTKHVKMIMCGIRPGSETERGLRSVGLWDDEKDTVPTFEDLNSALEYSENDLLKTFYSRKEAWVKPNAHTTSMDMPGSDYSRFHLDTSFSSPRRTHLHQVAHQTLQEHDTISPPRWQNFKQPLPLILQTFQGLTDKNEDFWFRACPVFTRQEYAIGTVLFRRGDTATGFYLLEHGIFRAEYHLPQGQFSENIVAGTTCGELPFFSGTERTATVVAERDCIAWVLNEEKWEELQKTQPEVAHEMLKISLKLTSERMAVITSYVLTTAG